MLFNFEKYNVSVTKIYKEEILIIFFLILEVI